MSTLTAINASEERFELGDIRVRFLLTGSDTNGSMSIFEMSVPAGRKIPAPTHRNDAYEETLYGLEGILTWTIDGAPFAVGPGQAVCIPRGAAHRFDNLGNEAARQLVVISPAVMGPEYFREVVGVMRAAAGTPPPPETMAAVFRRHGMTVAGPGA